MVTDPGIYKPVRPSQIRKSEKLVSNVIRVLTEDYVNPFGVNVDQENLVCLSSSVPVNEDAKEDLLSLQSRGKLQHETFVKSRLEKQDVPFHEPIKRNKNKGFTSRVKAKTGDKRSVDVNRDILARLLYLSNASERVIDFEKALTYPLSEVPLSISNADGSMRKTVKSKLSKLILSRCTDNNQDPDKQSTVYVVDLMALVRVATDIPETFEAFALKLLHYIPKRYHRVDLVADCYLANSIKDAERNKRGMHSKIIINSPKSRIPRDFSKFLACGENKTRMIQLLFETWTEKRAHCLNFPRTTQMILSREDECISLTLSDCIPYPALLSNHEEADTKVIAHSMEALQVRSTNHSFLNKENKVVAESAYSLPKHRLLYFQNIIILDLSYMM